MRRQQLILLLINVVGGVAVIGSYVYGVQAQPGGLDALWGGVPESIRPLYGVSMLIAAAGYLAVIHFLMLRLVPEDTSFGGSLDFSLLYPIFVGILLPSAFWMPLTNVYLASPGAVTWFAVRAVLALVGLASIALVWALVSLRRHHGGAAFWLAVAGSAYFAFHTAILDAIIWAPVQVNAGSALRQRLPHGVWDWSRLRPCCYSDAPCGAQAAWKDRQ